MVSERSSAVQSLMATLLVGYGYRFPSHPGKWWVHSNLTRILKPRLRSPQVVTRFGQRFKLTPDDYAQAQVYWFGERDHWEMHHVAKVLEPGAVVLDAGANFGYQALTLLRLTGQSCRIIAVEPQYDNFCRLKETIELNDAGEMVEVHRFALSDVSGTGRIVPDRSNSGHAMVRAGEAGDTVDIDTLDNFAERRGLERLDAILVDTEGLEARVISGGARTIARLRPAILVELWPPVLMQQGGDAAAVAKVLRDLDYNIYEIRKDRLVPATEMPTTDVRYYAMCFHKDRPQPAL